MFRPAITLSTLWMLTLAACGGDTPPQNETNPVAPEPEAAGVQSNLDGSKDVRDLTDSEVDRFCAALAAYRDAKTTAALDLRAACYDGAHSGGATTIQCETDAQRCINGGIKTVAQGFNALFYPSLYRCDPKEPRKLVDPTRWTDGGDFLATCSKIPVRGLEQCFADTIDKYASRAQNASCDDPTNSSKDDATLTHCIEAYFECPPIPAN